MTPQESKEAWAKAEAEKIRRQDPMTSLDIRACNGWILAPQGNIYSYQAMYWSFWLTFAAGFFCGVLLTVAGIIAGYYFNG